MRVEFCLRLTQAPRVQPTDMVIDSYASSAVAAGAGNIIHEVKVVVY